MAESFPDPTVSMAYLNGRLIPLREAHISVADGGLLYGVGFFETFRTSGGRPHLWPFHEARLIRSCARAGIMIPETFLVSTEAAMRKAVSACLRENGQGDAVFRYTITSGDERGPTELMTTRPLPETTGDSEICLRVLKVRRDSGEWIPRPKSVNYLNATLGLRELRSRKIPAADEGLFLSREGDMVVETPRQNLAWIVGDEIRVAADSAGAVAGTCQAWMHSLGHAISPVRSTLSDFLRADAIVCLNSVRGFTPVREVWDEDDARCLGRFPSAAHPLVRQLQREWQDGLLLTAQS